MKNLSVKKMFACQYGVDQDDVHVEFLWAQGDKYHFNVMVFKEKEERPIKVEFACESSPIS